MPDDIASAARRVAEDARRTGVSAPTVHLSAADAQVLLPVLDAVAAGQSDDGRVERWARELCRADHGGEGNWPDYTPQARATIALADAEAAARAAETNDDAAYEWMRRLYEATGGATPAIRDAYAAYQAWERASADAAG